MFARTILGAVCVAALIGGFAAGQEAADLRSVVDGPETAALTPPEELGPVDATLNAMSLEQKIAQLMFVTFGGSHNPSSDERRLLEGLTPGGVLLPNVTSPRDFEVYVRDLHMNPMQVEHNVPILIATNFFQLSGRKHSALPYAQLPTLLGLGASGDEQVVQDAAELVADYLNVLGVPVHFGPSLSLSSTLSSAAFGVNQFGEDAVLVSMAARGFHSGMTAKDVLWAPAMFPGGDANRSGTSPAALVTPLSTLETLDLAPYRTAIGQGVKLMHVGNTLVPTIDPTGVPASVSYPVMTTLLKEELGYTGLVIAGPMDAPDLTKYYKGSNAGIRSLLSGADMVYWNDSGPRIAQFVVQVAQAVENGELPESFIENKVRRVLTQKDAMDLARHEAPGDRDINKFMRAQAKNPVPQRLEQAGIVMLKVTPGVLPIRNEASTPVGITGIAGVDELYDALEDKKIEPLGSHRLGNALHAKQIFSFELDRVSRSAKETNTVVCLLGNSVRGSTQRELLRRFRTARVRTVTVLLGIPNDIDKYTELSDVLIVVMKSADSSLGATMAALADVLVGNGPVRVLEANRDLEVRVGTPVVLDANGLLVTPPGRLPVTASTDYPVGHGLGFAPVLDKRKIRWSFGDDADAQGPSVKHVYATPGRYTLTMTVEDEAGTSSGEFGVVVLPAGGP